MLTPIMSILVFSMLIIPKFLTGKTNQQFLDVIVGFMASVFSSTFILFLISIILCVVNFFI